MSSSSLSSHWLFTTTCSSDPWASSWYVTDPHTCGSFRLESLSWPSYETLYSIVAFQTWVILERVLKKAQTLEHTQMSSIDCKYPTQYVDASNAHTYCNRLFFFSMFGNVYAFSHSLHLCAWIECDQRIESSPGTRFSQNRRFPPLISPSQLCLNDCVNYRAAIKET